MKFKIKRAGGYAVVLAALLCLCPPAARAGNVLGNNSFEEEIGNGTGGDWDASNGAVRTTPGDGTYPFATAPSDGDFALLLTTTAQFTFQTNDQVHPGDFVTFSGWALSDIAAPNGGEVRIEFKKVLSNGTDILISTVENSADRITAANAPDGGAFQQFTVSGYAPPETGRVVFVLREQGADGNVLFDRVHAEINPVKLQVAASKNNAKVGDVVTVFAKYRNDSPTALAGVEFHSSLPKGFDVLPQSVRLNGRPQTYREGSVVIPVGTLGIGDEITTSFQVLATSIVQRGKQYEIELFVTSAGLVSEKAYLHINVVGDPVFEEGTIIGKVFNDENQNGIQDCGDKGVPGARLVTEEGIVVITDDAGRYHIPAVKPGRHVVKIDGHTLPEGTKFITEEAYLVKTTPGIMNRANFAVLLPPSTIPEEFQKELTVMVTQGMDTARPALGVTMTPSLLKAGLGVFEQDPVFRFKINYPDFVKNWYLEIRDELGREVWTGYGVSAPPPEVVWSGKTEDGLFVKPGIYSYRFKVEDRSNRQDWTPLGFFRVIPKANAENEANLQVEIPSVGDFNIFQDGKQSIPLVAKPTLHIRGKTRPGNKVTINNQPVETSVITGVFDTEIYTSPGEKEIVVTTTNPEGESVTHRETVKVKDSIFFMTALGEEQLGANWTRGDLEAVGASDEFKETFYEDGRLSYYLIGKLKGKFLVKSHYDTDDKRSALFTNLDPDDYYPVYGDKSQINYEAQDTASRFFTVVEMDRSYVKWGSYKTNFTDTELSRYNRTLSGLKIHYETLGSTPYGDPNRGFDVFWNEARHLADHNEFAATGGSLYYLRNRSVIQGSEKIRVEIRDKIQDMPLSSYDLAEGKDYEIDYDEGRLLLSRPLSSMAASDTLVTLDILDGNPVYLIVDYEYDAPATLFDNKNRGLRGYTHMGDHLKVGGTFVEEKRQNYDYDLRGVDATVKLGRNTKVTAEYATSQNQQVKNSLSYNGGLSFTELSPIRGEDKHEEAWLVKAESKPVKNGEISGYIQNVQPGFSTERIRSQEGYKKYGLAARYKLSDHLYFRYRYDTSELVNQLRPVETHGISTTFETRKTHDAQVVYENAKWLAELEYLRQNTELTKGNLVPSLLSEMPLENGVGAKLGYRLNDRLLPYAKVQSAIHGKSNHQFGGGLRYEVARDLYAYVEQMFGKLGDSTFFGFERFHENGGKSYFNLRSLDRGIGHKTLATNIGSSYPLTGRSRFYSEREHSSYDSVDGFADILGIEGTINPQWDYDLKFERRHLDGDISAAMDSVAASSLTYPNTTNVLAGALGFADSNIFRTRTALELRVDQDDPEMRQWVTRSSIEYQINPDLAFLGKLDFGKSRFLEPDGTPASFTEMNVGFAYRPVACDRLNFLTRYTYVNDIANDLQFSTGLFQGLETDEQSHIFAIDLAYDLFKYLELVQKLAYKKGLFATAYTDAVVINNLLWVNRFNFHVTRKWDVALEYRTLWQSEAADSLRHGPLLEVDREFYDYVRLGLGYNFTDFDDDLRKANNFRSHGPFVRLTGKF